MQVEGPLCFRRYGQLPRRALQKVFRQGWNVVRPLAKRGNLDLDDTKPVKEILAKVPGRHALAEVAIGRGNQAHVDMLRPVADGLDFAVLEKPQQCRLHPEAHFPDFVEEQRAAVRHLNPAETVPIGASEAAARMAEELRLEERLRKTRAVHGDVGPTAPVRTVVRLPGKDVFPDPAFAGNQNLRVGLTRAPGHFDGLPHRRACADEGPGPIPIC